MTKKKELAKNTFIIFLGKVSTQFITFFLLPLYTKYLNTGEYGTIDLIVTYITLFVPVCTIQQEMATFRFLIDNRTNEEKKSKIIFNSLKNILISAIIFALVFVTIGMFINIPYQKYILINVVVVMFSGLLLQTTRGLGKNVTYSLSSFITGISTLLFNILFIVKLNIGGEGILISTTISNFICIIYIFFSLKIYKYLKISNYDKKISKDMLSYSLPLVPNGISWWVINVSDRTIISNFLSVAANGIYAVSTKFSSIISSIFSIFNMSWTESASLHINDEDRNEFFSEIADIVIRLFSCLCLGIIASMPYVFNFFIKGNYIDAYYYIPINLLASFFNCVVGIYSSIYIAKKLTKQVMMTSLVSAIINIFINLMLIKQIGVYAACLSTVIAYFSMAIYRHFDLKKYVQVKYKLTTLIPTFFAFIITFIIYYLDNKYLNLLGIILIVLYSIIMNREIIVNIKRFLFKK